MPQFKDLDSLLAYVSSTAAGILQGENNTEKVLRDEMREAVIDYVYSAYNPKSYVRREDDDGLSDVRNMNITFVENRGNKVFVTFENMTKGNDNLQGKTTSDLIEYGDGKNGKHWTYKGEWSNPRPFVAPMKAKLQSNPSKLQAALKKDLQSKRFKFK